MAATRSQLRLGDVGEHGFLAGLLAALPHLDRDVIVGPGDDCAVVAVGKTRLLLTSDALVEGSHFERGWLTPRQLGVKAFFVNASDIAAMGGRPRWAVVQLSAPAHCPARELSEIQRGIVRAARDAGAAIVGGNLTRDTKLSISICLIGVTGRRIVLRRGARPGDLIFVTGTLGDSALGLRTLQLGARREQAIVRRFIAPRPRLEAGWLLAQRGVASAMIDVSDGLLQDLGHLCDASDVGARLDSRRVPRSTAHRRLAGGDLSTALAGGEDYELLFTVSKRRLGSLDSIRGELKCRATAIGEITADRGIRVDHGPQDGQVGGFDHFRVASPAPPRGRAPGGRPRVGSAKADV